MRFIVTSFLILGICIPFQSHAEELNAGFVQGIWFGAETVFADTPVRIYVALRNNTENDLTGTVRFNDNEKRVGTSYVSALPGRLVEAWVDWTPTYGEHIIVATLTNTQQHTLGADPEIVEVISAQAEQTIFVDRDTDKDGVGNKDDTDDDNDKVSDTDEVTAGTDPLVYNSHGEDNETDEEETNDAQSEEDETTEESKTSETTEKTENTNSKKGLEQYIENEIVHNVLSDVTDTVSETKQSLDTYRTKRNAEVPAPLSGTQTLIEAEKALYSTSSPFTNATITRTTIEKSPGMLKSLLTAIIAFVATMYTFVLWLLSEILGHPALIQFALLLLILIICYTLARKLGGRPKRE